MLTLLRKSAARGRFCDGLSRRDFLIVGGSIAGGLSLSSLLRAESQQGIRRGHKSLINIFLPGGPPHQDMWDLKPDAPAEIRGEFKPISTNVPGIQICELFPKLAAMMDKLIVVRSIVDARGPHFAEQCMSPRLDPNSPSLGAWVSRLQGPACAEIPPNLSLCYRTSLTRLGRPGRRWFPRRHTRRTVWSANMSRAIRRKTRKNSHPIPGIWSCTIFRWTECGADANC